MFNKLNKEQALHLLNKESFKRKTVSFYKYVIIEKPNELRDNLYSSWKNLEVLGRIYLAKEGINAQLSVPEHNWLTFVENVLSKNKTYWRLSSLSKISSTLITSTSVFEVAASSRRLTFVSTDLRKAINRTETYCRKENREKVTYKKNILMTVPHKR